MSAITNDTMQNPLYGVQSAHFRQAVERAHEERTRVLRKLGDLVFGRRSSQHDPDDKQAEIDKANAIAMDMLRYGRLF